jgi:hypothetical protein
MIAASSYLWILLQELKSMLDRLETKYAATAGVAPALTSLPGGSTAVGGDLMVEQPSEGSQVTGELFVRIDDDDDDDDDVFYLFLQKQNRSRAPYIP